MTRRSIQRRSGGKEATACGTQHHRDQLREFRLCLFYEPLLWHALRQRCLVASALWAFSRQGLGASEAEIAISFYGGYNSHIVSLLEGLIEQLLADFEERAQVDFTPRDIEIPWLAGKADVLIGMRRTGKTWLMRQILTERVSDPKYALYINFEDERLWQLQASELHLIVDIFYRRNPSLRESQCAFFFDEIQNVEGWERFVRRLIDTENVHVCVSGSSAKMLSREIGTALRGRSLATEVFPYSFREFCRHHGVDIPNKRPGQKNRSILEATFGRYLESGGFPEIQGLESSLRARVLQEYVDAVILRDVIERHHVSNAQALRRLVRHMLQNPASLFSVHRFYHDVRSQGLSVSKDTLYELMDHLHDAYFVFPVQICADSERTRQSNPRKIYLIDHGLALAHATRRGQGVGHLLEGWVFIELRRKYRDISYFRHTDGTEVDFVVGQDDARQLIQVSADITSSDTRLRELRALSSAMEQMQIEEATIVTLTAEETIALEAGTVHVVPAWMWGLGLTR